MERKLCGIQLLCILLYVIFSPASSQGSLKYCQTICSFSFQGTLRQPNHSNGIVGKSGHFIATAKDGAINASVCGSYDKLSGFEAAVGQIAMEGYFPNLSEYPNSFSKCVKIESSPAELPIYGTSGIQIPMLYNGNMLVRCSNHLEVDFQLPEWAWALRLTNDKKLAIIS